VADEDVEKLRKFGADKKTINTDAARTLGARGTSAQKLRTAPTTAGAVRLPTARVAAAVAAAIIYYACEEGQKRTGYCSRIIGVRRTFSVFHAF